jgi:hypothetical protein
VLGYNYPGSKWYENAYSLVGSGDLPPSPKKGWFGLGSLF